jgi:GrpB-like predicted nucleotidyltransferase (UPF0157 family)
LKDPVIIENYNDEWPREYEVIHKSIVDRIKASIIRIDHIGSTAVPGLAAKPIIDIQISVSDLTNIEYIKNELLHLGYQFRQDNPDLTKRYFRETQSMRRTHIHIRESGSWSEQFNLLFRDYLRVHEHERNEYAEIKYKLAKEFRENRQLYIEGKSEIVWKIMTKANRWSQEIGWKPS